MLLNGPPIGSPCTATRGVLTSHLRRTSRADPHPLLEPLEPPTCGQFPRLYQLACDLLCNSNTRVRQEASPSQECQGQSCSGCQAAQALDLTLVRYAHPHYHHLRLVAQRTHPHYHHLRVSHARAAHPPSPTPPPNLAVTLATWTFTLFFVSY
ncbi:hypothetical protein BGY98DRAFT_710697 [Russula aff. rugulosa BPL654]|nr:hypothetical protein BGY98DRAFT_710697 [Russula aff. rugulosa BPL654]